jgi:hypothetical protein
MFIQRNHENVPAVSISIRNRARAMPNRDVAKVAKEWLSRVGVQHHD